MLPTAPILDLFQNDGAPGEQGGGSPGEASTTVDGAPPPDTDEAPGNPLGFLGPIAIIFLIFWILIIGPERKARKKQESMRSALKKGDEVMTTGGMFGKVVAIDEEKVVLQIADSVRVKYLRQAIQGRVGDELEDGKGGKDKDDKGKSKDEEPKLESGED